MSPVLYLYAMTRRLIAASLAFTLIAQAAAFGTVDAAGQSAEHERITRAGLAAAGIGAATMDMLAGKKRSFGAVGAPDRPDRGLLGEQAAHCDGADTLDVPGYPQSPAAAGEHLRACRAWMTDHLAAAVAAAANLVPEGAMSVADKEIPTHVACVFDGKPGRAKCDVLENLGLALHAAQDFYAHSNWTDRSPPGAIGPENPPGLGHDGPAPWLDPRAPEGPLPPGLITGCYDGFPENLYCTYSGGKLRVRHAVLDKDTGTIDAVNGIGRDGTTLRGAMGDNFARAVSAAVSETGVFWSAFEDEVLAAYGTARGGLILCAVKADDPATCR